MHHVADKDFFGGGGRVSVCVREENVGLLWKIQSIIAILKSPFDVCGVNQTQWYVITGVMYIIVNWYYYEPNVEASVDLKTW